jgi:hypothetical protein
MTTVTASRGFEIGRVVTRTFAALQANLGPFLLIGLLFGGLPLLVGGWLQSHPIAQPLQALASILVFVLQIAGSAVLQAAVMFGTVRYLDGEQSSISDWVSRATAHWWPLLLLNLLIGLITGVAALALVVPGFIVAVRWVAAAPALVIEDIPVTKAMARSADLTKGRRWAVFGLLVIYVIPLLVVQFTLIGFATRFQAGFSQAMAATSTRLIVLPLFNVIAAPITAVGVGALYRELTLGREGAGSLSVAKVFD